MEVSTELAAELREERARGAAADAALEAELLDDLSQNLGKITEHGKPFFTTKPTGEGTGLGLSLSYNIVTQGHGGTLTVASAENQFTGFLISLPVHLAG